MGALKMTILEELNSLKPANSRTVLLQSRPVNSDIFSPMGAKNFFAASSSGSNFTSKGESLAIFSQDKRKSITGGKFDKRRAGQNNKLAR